MRLALVLAPVLALLATPVSSGIDEAVNTHILPRLATFSDATRALETAAEENCLPDTVAAPYDDAFDAWMGVADLRLGPSETRALSIAFWPDTKGHTQRTLSRLIDTKDGVVQDPTAFSDFSIAGRGFFALERMLFDENFNGYDAQSYSCDLVQAITRDLATQAATLNTEWRDDFVNTLLAPGAEGNVTYLDETEAVRAIYTQIVSSLEFTAQTRLGRPLGEVDRPRPRRAEAWRSKRSLSNSMLAVQSAYDLAHALADWDLPETDTAMARLRTQADQISDPGFQDISNLMNRLDVELLQQEITGLKTAIQVEIGTRLGISAGFNASDGD